MGIGAKNQNIVSRELWDLMTKTFKGVAKLRDSQKETNRQMKKTSLFFKESELKADKEFKRLSDLFQ